MTTPFHDPANPTHNHGIKLDNRGKPIAVYGAAASLDDTVGHSHTLEEYYKLHSIITTTPLEASGAGQ
jgi:hypothetical protein